MNGGTKNSGAKNGGARNGGAGNGDAGSVGVSSGEEREDFPIEGETLSFPP